MKLRAVFSAATLAAVAFGATAVLAQQDPILARQELMKANGKEAKVGAAMAKGEKAFDLAAAKKIFVTFENAAQKMPDLFPPNSKTGHKTTAAPKIWEDMADFKARFKKFGDDAKKAEGIGHRSRQLQDRLQRHRQGLRRLPSANTASRRTDARRSSGITGGAC